LIRFETLYKALDPTLSIPYRLFLTHFSDVDLQGKKTKEENKEREK